MVETLDTVKAFIELQFSTPVTLCTDPGELFDRYQNDHCFNATVQGCYTVKGLTDFYTKADRHTLYELREPLGTCSLRFFLRDTLVMVGPYTETEWHAPAAQIRLQRACLQADTLQAYRLYACRYSVVQTRNMLRAVAAMLELEGLSFESYSYHRLEEKGLADSGQATVPERYDYRRINEEHALEKGFMAAVAEGNEAHALAMLEEMCRRIPREQLAIAQSSSYRLVAATIMRTIVRLAAGQSCLPPIVVDAITESYAQRLEGLGRIPGEEESHRLAVDMIRELCTEINRQQMAGYPPLVCKALHYIRMNLGHDLSLPALARELGVTPGHLSKVFRAQTGEGISLCIRRERCKKAAELLCTTSNAVQDISGLVGYADANYFIKAFKKEFGMTPTQYRNQNQ